MFRLSNKEALSNDQSDDSMKTESTFCGLLIKGDNLNIYLSYLTLYHYKIKKQGKALQKTLITFYLLLITFQKILNATSGKSEEVRGKK